MCGNSQAVQNNGEIQRFATAIGTTPKVMKVYLPALAGMELSFADEEIEQRVLLIENAGNYANSPYVLSKAEMREIYRRLFGKSKK